MNRKAVSRIVIILTVAFCTLVFCCCQTNNHHGNGKPLFELLNEKGIQFSSDQLIDSLTNEQTAILDIAFNSDVELGYQEPKTQWVSEKLLAHENSEGEIVVVLPDGGEFTISSLNAKKADENVSTSKASSDSSHYANEASSDLSLNDTENSGSNSDLDNNGSNDTFDNNSSSSSLGGSSSEQNTSAQSATDNLGTCVVSSVQVHTGETNVAVPVCINHNPGILGLTLSVSYDESVMTLRAAENGRAFKDALSLTHSRSLETGCLFTWDGVDLSPSNVKDGEILTLYFDIANNAQAGSYPLVVRSVGSVLDSSLNKVALAIEDGKVEVK